MYWISALSPARLLWTTIECVPIIDIYWYFIYTYFYKWPSQQCSSGKLIRIKIQYKHNIYKKYCSQPIRKKWLIKTSFINGVGSITLLSSKLRKIIMEKFNNEKEQQFWLTYKPLLNILQADAQRLIFSRAVRTRFTLLAKICL